MLAVSLPIVALCGWLFFSSWKDSSPDLPTVSLPPAPPKLSHDQAIAKAALSLKPIAIPAALSITPQQKSASVPALVVAAPPPAIGSVAENAGLAEVPQMRWRLATPLPQDINAGPTKSMDWDVALHPSLKYSGGAAVSLIAPTPDLRMAALSIPTIDLNPHPTTAPTARPAAKPAAESAESVRSRLIAENLRMEDARKFVMSLCQDQQGCIWVGCEEDKPGTGGVQRFDPSAPELHQWTQFTTKDGLGDNNGYAIACDKMGRIWVGHLRSGVSVWNGVRWQNYEVVGGLSRPDTLSGPLGERVFAIKVCEKTGDVWISTNCGLSIYSESSDSWRYITRAAGLPSDQSNAIALDADGNVYVGTQCDGITMAKAADNYKTWRTVTGPDQPPLVPAGPGLPTNLINDVLVAHDGTVYAATNTGVAWSGDHGDTWRFTRGKDWEAKIVAAPKGWKPLPGAWLAEDFVTSLAEGENGSLWVGYRRSGVAKIDPRRSQCFELDSRRPFVSTMADGILSSPVLGTYGDGLGSTGSAFARQHDPDVEITHAVVELPGAAAPLTPQQLAAMADSAANAARAFAGDAAYFTDDWATGGDWVGRFGSRFAVLFAMKAPLDDRFAPYPGYHIACDLLTAGFNDKPRRWIQTMRSDSSRALYDLQLGNRREAELDDHGEEHPRTLSGPGLSIHLTIPMDMSIVSVYFFNPDGHAGNQADRDYRLALRAESGGAATTLACARCQTFWGGVYKRFIVRKSGGYQIAIERSGSMNTICSGIFVDTIAPADASEARPYPLMYEATYPQIPWPAADAHQQYAQAVDAYQAQFSGSAFGSSVLSEPFRRQLLRAVLKSGPSACTPCLLWDSHLWGPAARREFDQRMRGAWELLQLRFSQFRSKVMSRFGPDTH